MFSCLKNTCIATKDEVPVWFFQSSRLILSIFFLIVPVLYDSSVPEVGADMKWTLAHAVSLFVSGLLFISWFTSKPVIKLKWPISVWAMIIFSIFAILSIIDAYNPLRSWWFLKHLISYSLIFFLVYSLRNEDWYKGILAILLAPFTFNSVLGILQFFVIKDADITAIFPLWEHVSPFIDIFRQSAPPAATFANKNLAASYTVMMLPIALYAVLVFKHKVSQILAGISLTLGLIFLIYTRSRGSWIAAIFASLFLITWVLTNNKNRKLLVSVLSKFKLIILSFVIVVTIFAAQFNSNVSSIYVATNQKVSDQFSSIARMGTGDVGTRIAYFLNSLKIIADHPINGVGLSNFQTIYPLYHHAIYETPKVGYAVEARPQRSHNDFIQAFVETGILGGLAFITIFLSTLYMGYKLARSTASADTRLISIFILTSVAGVGVNAMGDFPFQMPIVPIITWTLISILTGLFTIHYRTAGNIGFNYKFTIKPVICLIIGSILFFGFVKILNDDLTREKAAKYMKYVMSYSAAHIFNDKVLDSLDKAYKIYPYNARTLEYRGTIPVNYKGKRKISLDTLIKQGEESIEHDPYAPNNLINLGGSYFRKAMQADRLGNNKVALEYADKTLEIYKRLLPLAYFAPHTYSLAGYAYLIKEKANIAASFFEKALEIDPKYVSALNGLALSVKALKLEGYTDADINVIRGKQDIQVNIFNKEKIIQKLKDRNAVK